MSNAYVVDENSIKLPKEISEKLKLKKGMELKVLPIEDDGIIILKISKESKKDFADIKGIGKELWKDIDAQEYVNKEREGWN